MVTLNNRAFMYMPCMSVSHGSILKQLATHRGQFVPNSATTDFPTNSEAVPREMMSEALMVRIAISITGPRCSLPCR